MVPKKSSQPEDAERNQADKSMLDMDGKELNRRLEWIDTEISLLSTQTGVSERILALNFTRAKILAIKWIQQAAASSRQCTGPGTQSQQ